MEPLRPPQAVLDAMVAELALRPTPENHSLPSLRERLQLALQAAELKGWTLQLRQY